MSFRLLVSLLVLSLATSCSSAALTRRTLPTAVADHLDTLPGFDVRAHVVVPFSAAWNVAIEHVRSRAPLAVVDPGYPVMQTHAHYDVSLTHGVRKQQRARWDVTFAPDPRRGLRSQSIEYVSERRQGICDAYPSPWTAETTHSTNLDSDIAAAVDALADVPAEWLVFESDPGSLAQRLADSEQLYLVTVGFGPDGSPFVDAIGRESAANRRDVQIQVRSGYHADFIAAEGGTRVRVQATLEHRTAEQDLTASEWTGLDASRVAEGVYGALAALAPVRDLVLPSPSPRTDVDAPAPEPAMAPPVDDYRGPFVLTAAFTANPGRRGDYAFWQNTTAVQVVAQVVDQTLAFDPVSAYAASGWIPRSLSVTLSGDAPLAVSIANGDPAAGAMRIPYATVNVSQLVTACGPVCFDSDGGNVCLLMRRP